MSKPIPTFLDRMRERAAKTDEAIQNRLDEIKERPVQKKKTSRIPQSPTWINSQMTDSAKKKQSILNMLHGDVTTKSPTQRS